MTRTALGRWRLADLEATHRAGAALAQSLQGGAFIALEGELGAGKTSLAKGLIASLTGLDADDIVSPTFALVVDYDEGPRPVLHLDAYRLTSGDALIELGFTDWLDGEQVIVLEWPEKVLDALPEEGLWLRLEHDAPGRWLTLEAWDATEPLARRAREALSALLET